MKTIQRIRQKVIDKDYYLSDHAEEEMLDDDLERSDIEHAILKGRIEKKRTEDIRGTRYRIEGPAVVVKWSKPYAVSISKVISSIAFKGSAC